MIKHILKIIWTQRYANLLIWTELVVVLILFWMVTNQLLSLYNLYRMPKGFDIENTYFIDVQMVAGREQHGSSNNQDSLEAAYETPFYTLLEQVKRNPNILYASASLNSRPYNGSNMWAPMVSGKKSIDTYLRMVDNNFFKVFSIPIKYGKDLDENNGSKIVISTDVAQTVFDNIANASGKTFESNGERFTVAGITEYYKYYEYDFVTPTAYYPFKASFKNFRGSFRTPEICIKMKPNASKDAIPQLGKDLAKLSDSPYYIRDIVPFEKIRKDYFLLTGEVKTIRINLAIILFFLVNVLLGIIGSFWFRTEQRRNEIGLRMALGSSTAAVKRFYLTESMLLLLFATIPSTIVVLQLKIFDINLFGYWDNSWIVITLAGILSFAIMALMVLLGTWIPTRLASRVQPAEALHYE